MVQYRDIRDDFLDYIHSHVQEKQTPHWCWLMRLYVHVDMEPKDNLQSTKSCLNSDKLVSYYEESELGSILLKWSCHFLLTSWNWWIIKSDEFFLCVHYSQEIGLVGLARGFQFSIFCQSMSVNDLSVIDHFSSICLTCLYLYCGNKPWPFGCDLCISWKLRLDECHKKNSSLEMD